MDGTIYSVVYIAVFIIGIVSMFMTIVSFAGVITNVREDRKRLVSIVAPMVFVLPKLLNDAGRKYKARFLIYASCVVLSVVSLYIFEAAYGKPPYMQSVVTKAIGDRPHFILIGASRSD